MNDSIVWISGATNGLGEGLARHCPIEGARIISISRRRHPSLESVVADLSDPADWNRVREHFQKELSAFKGKRVMFVHNAYYADGTGVLGHVPAEDYQTAVLVNSAAPLVLGEAFLTAAAGKPYEAGLVLLSTSAHLAPMPGLSAYSAAKIGVEYWAEVVKRELAAAADNRWVVAVRPGGIATPGSARNGNLPAERFPHGQVRKRMPGGDAVDIDTGAIRFWNALSPRPTQTILSFRPRREAPPEDNVRYMVV